MPFIALLYIAGIGLFGINSFLKYADKRDAERVKEKQAEQTEQTAKA